jgi:lysophospholipase L1-like esterase
MRIKGNMLAIILSLLPIAMTFGQKVLVIGDSNSAIENTWTTFLPSELLSLELLNKSVSGNTIGFDNNGQSRLNTLKNLSDYLGDLEAFNDSVPDVIVFLLGTNDCKHIFDGKTDTIHSNFLKLLDESENFFTGKQKPQLLVVSPPPQDPEPAIALKYKGGDECAAELTEFYKQVTGEKHIDFLDIYHPLKPVFRYITIDGIHLNREGQVILSRMVSERIKEMGY